MAAETVFLSVLVVALVIGNALLSFIPSENSSRQTQKSILRHGVGLHQSSMQGKLVEPENTVLGQPIQSEVLFSNFNALNSKLNMLLAQFESFETKTRKFDHFRANTEVELRALKEIIVELQNKYVTVPSKKIRNPKGLTNDEMHKIIYRSK